MVQGDEEKEFMFTRGRRNTVIDYIIDIEVRNKILKMTVEDGVDSNHHPVEVRLEGEVKRIRNGDKHRKCWRGIWDEEGRNEFNKKMSRLKTGGRELDED